MTINEISQTLEQIRIDGKTRIKLKSLNEDIKNEELYVLDLPTKVAVLLYYKNIHTLEELKVFLEKSYDVFRLGTLGKTGSKKTLLYFIAYTQPNDAKEICDLFY